jgi:putative flippase GtrA
VLKPVVSLAAVGFIGVLLYKLLLVLLLPAVGMVIGFAAMVIKIALIAMLVWAGFWLFRKLTEKPSEA